MPYIRECPYCQTMMKEYTYTKDDTPQYLFMCDCSKGEFKHSRDAAYENYLHERENNQATNFDKYFSSFGSMSNLDSRMDRSCAFYEGDCNLCTWGKLSRILGGAPNANCSAFWEWVLSPVGKQI